MKKRIRTIANFFWLMLVLTSSFAAFGALTPQQVAQKAASLVAANKGIKATFTVTASGQSFKGSVISEGNRFVVETPRFSSWHDGKNLYTYNSNVDETILITPTAAELLESNPLLYVRNAASAFSCSFAKSAPKGKYILEMTPVNKRSPISMVTVTVNAKTFQPEKIMVKATGHTSTVTVDSFVSGLDIPSGTFSYPKAKYPDTEIIDLR